MMKQIVLLTCRRSYMIVLCSVLLPVVSLDTAILSKLRSNTGAFGNFRYPIAARIAWPNCNPTKSHACVPLRRLCTSFTRFSLLARAVYPLTSVSHSTRAEHDNPRLHTAHPHTTHTRRSPHNRAICQHILLLRQGYRTVEGIQCNRSILDTSGAN